MATRSKPEENSYRKRPPATTPEARENQIAALAYDLAEKQIREGTASSQVLTHFLKISSTKEKLEKEILEKQKSLITAKTEAIESAKVIQELYKDAMAAFSSYSGGSRRNDEDEDY